MGAPRTVEPWLPAPTEADSASAAFVNHGMIVLRQRLLRPGPRTIIVSGVARSGTSLAATILVGAGIPMGETADAYVVEDTEIAVAIATPDRIALQRLIAQRNARNTVWGFKRPNLHLAIRLADLGLFRAPRLVLTFRDPVAIAERNVIAMTHSGGSTRSVEEAAQSLHRLAGFAAASGLPTLLVSYEKAIGHAREFVRRLTAFCGLAVDAAEAERLAEAVNPDEPSYRVMTRAKYEGYIDRCDNNTLYGWGWCAGQTSAAELELLVDGCAVRRFIADRFRGDLKDAGYLHGHFGFAETLSDLSLSGTARLAVRFHGQDMLLQGSGATLDDIRAGRHRSISAPNR